MAAVFSVRRDPAGQHRLTVLLWRRGQEPDLGRWALPGGIVRADEDVDSSARRQLAQKVDLTRVAHLEQIGVFSDPGRVPGGRVVATGFLGLVPMPGDGGSGEIADARLPADTAWHPVDDLPPTALDHGAIAERARQRLRAKIGYTNIGFALAPAEFTLAELGRIWTATLGHEVDPTNLQRILTRRGMLQPTGTTAPPGPAGGRPAALFRFTVAELRVTDPFAAFRPPGS
ncbi:NUDIX hydrolase [Nakamurella flavida]|uniref:NUDIX hydrolase n=1 Tax=Nakamurella flavida TaxID=363630 RepID=A0A938YEC5_9ACTN|nr:NUDIX domain-containing protein [Nakamurella flavida]MBM9476106.1 NUDIX hydrolase [Nakamurella flavida]